MESFGYLCLFVVMMVVGPMLDGYALSVLWGWFVAPTFGLPLLTYGVAAGIALTVRYLTRQVDHSEEKKELGMPARVAIVLLKPVLALGFGWFLLKAFV